MFFWLFILELFGFLSLPLTHFLFHRLKDKGYGFSKIVGILFFSFITWYLSFAVRFEISIILSIVILFLINLYLKKKTKVSFERKIVKVSEAIFILSFILFSFLRSFTPAVEGLEKLFDISLINGILQSNNMPPNDPWFASYKVNYYYFGHFIVASLTKLSFLPSYITFNLSLAMIYSILAAEIFSLSFNLTGKLKFGFFGIFLFLFISNLLGFLQILTFLEPKLVEFFSDKFDIKYAMTCCHDPSQNFFRFLSDFPVWPSTRVIPNTINEFPYANFLFGEVHSHIISLPIQLLLIVTLFCIYISKKYEFFLVVFSSFLLAILYTTNSWDVPIYFIFFLLVNLIMFFEKRINFRILIFSMVFVLILFLTFSLPHILTVKKKTNFGLVNERSNIFQELVLFPVFIFSISYYYIKKKGNKFLFTLIFSIVVYFLTQIQLFILLLPFTILALNEIVKNRKTRFVNILILLGSLAMLSTEIFYLDSRYNSVFKFYYHVWIFWSISSIFIVNEL